MNAAMLAFIVLVCFALGYRFYSRYLGQKVFDLDDRTSTPAVEKNDAVDFVPTPKSILFGHHYASIAGAAPIVGPAVAVIWGWVPALLWVVLGTIFMGAAHDFGVLVTSMRHKGKSIGQVAADVIGIRARNLFVVVIFFLVWMVIAVFALVIANLFISFPSSVIPVNFEILVAVLIGLHIRKKGGGLLVPALLAQLGLLVMIWLGTQYPVSLEPYFGGQQRMVWILFLLGYSFIASVLPVWVLLQPRDYINSHQLFLGLGLMILGLFIVQPMVVAPAFNLQPLGAPSWFPFLFITIACGAISGFHGLVSGGTTSKQVRRWSDARPIGYGGMLGEGLLALLATLAVTAGFANVGEWHGHYSSWGAAKGLSASLDAFVLGASRFLAGLGIPREIGATFIAVLIISFAATSLDTACRIQRYILGEVGETWKIKALRNRYLASGLAVGSALLLMLMGAEGKGGLLIWPLFGATNQMLAALSLIIITVYLLRMKKSAKFFLIPALFLVVVTSIGLFANIGQFFATKKYMLGTLGIVLLCTQVWLIIEGYQAVRRLRQQNSKADSVTV